MIFTIGYAEAYERYFREQSPLTPRKLGRVEESDYPGDSVWETREAAQAYLDREGIADTHRVYGVEADWERDTVQSADGHEWHDLLHSAFLVRLEL